MQSIGTAFTEPRALERLVSHGIGDRSGSLLLDLLIGDSVVHSRNLATAVGADPGIE